MRLVKILPFVLATLPSTDVVGMPDGANDLYEGFHGDDTLLDERNLGASVVLAMRV